ncbi:MAG TPA: N-acetyltransferase family protein [Bacteroidia bacterium]|nr:N-acetyltransferase family protein [Bacteroidia bacterium]HNU32424.1 N-acetyltransferase family protein [Bacteroidia bacterium]
MLSIRPATKDDVVIITEIYNDAILNSTATFDTDIKTIDDRMSWFLSHDKNHPVIVGEINEEVVGWASLTKWSDRCAYDGTSEVSVYVHKSHRGKGVGKRLLEILIAEGEKCGLHYLLSRITEGNETSIHIHERLGFTHVGVMHEVGFKFGKFLDVHIMEKVFKTN